MKYLFILFLFLIIRTAFSQKLLVVTDSCQLHPSSLFWEFTDSSITQRNENLKVTFLRRSETKPFTMLNDTLLKAYHWEMRDGAGFTLLYNKVANEWIALIDESIKDWQDHHYPIDRVVCNQKCLLWLDSIK